MNKKFLEAVNANDIVSVRLFLSNELLIDPRGDTFCQMLKFAESNCSSLYEDKVSSFNIIEDTSIWNQNYLNELKNELDTHFIKNLLIHYKNVVSIVLKDKIRALDAQENVTKKNTQIESKFYKEVACGTLLVGGAALTITGLYLSKGNMVKMGSVCIVAGGLFAFTGGLFAFKLIINRNYGK